MALISNYNTYVEDLLKKDIKGANLTFYDAHAWFEEWITNPGPLGLSVGNGPCIWGIGIITILVRTLASTFFMILVILKLRFTKPGLKELLPFSILVIAFKFMKDTSIMLDLFTF